MTTEEITAMCIGGPLDGRYATHKGSPMTYRVPNPQPGNVVNYRIVTYAVQELEIIQWIGPFRGTIRFWLDQRIPPANLMAEVRKRFG